jgi:flagellar FliJ protein
MTKKFALQRVLEIADIHTESAAASLAALNRQLLEHEEKLLQLFQYRTDYQDRLRRAIVNGVDGAGLRNFHNFMERLEDAILQQHAVVVDARTRVDGGRHEWHGKRRKSKAYDALSQRFELTIRHDEAKREQKIQDTFADRTTQGKSQVRR